MKKCIYCSFNLLLLLLLLNFSSSLCANSMAAKQRDEKVNIMEVISGESAVNLEELMGLEECESTRDDKECLKRRIIAEAHLDYIYTQHQSP